MISKKFKKGIILITVLFLPLFFVDAEILTSENDIYIKMVPENPGANQTVSINIESYLTDLNRAEIIWYKNDVIKQRGNGQKTFSFETRGLGSSDTITIQVKSIDIGTITKNITITPAEVGLIWEADSYTPPFYKGKALNSRQSKIKVVAVPNFVSSNGNSFDSKNLIYQWKKDWKILGKYSGYGKNTLVLDGNQILTDTIISVEVETTDGSIKSQKRITISNYDPEIIFYKEDPLLGVMYEKAITNRFDLNDEEIIIKVAPFFFSNKDNLKYNWSMNNKKLTDLEEQDFIILRQGEDTGITNLSLEIQNLDKIMQFARNSFNISFNGVQKTPIFGVVDIEF